MASANGSMHITRWGTSGPRVVMVHGGAQGSAAAGERNFAAQQPLADRFQLIVPDRPGHGRSPDPGRPDDAEADGAWVAELLEDGAHLVGHSFGGAVALSAAARRPQAVRSLTLIEPAMHKLADGDPRVRRFGLGMMTAMLFSLSAASRAKKVMEHLGIPAEIRAAAGPQELERLGKSLGRLRPPSKPVLARQLATIKQADVALLVVSGGWSDAFEATCDVVAATGGGQHIVVKCPHHFPQWMGSDFNALLTEFIGRS